MSNDNRNNAIAAGVIFLVVCLALYFMPTMVLAIGQWSPVAGFAAGAAVILGFFAIFWVRSRYRR